jgi:hypothetical protein
MEDHFNPYKNPSKSASPPPDKRAPPSPTQQQETPAMAKMSAPVAALASLALAACTTTTTGTAKLTPADQTGARYTYPETPVLTSGERVPRHFNPRSEPVHWPLRFESHTFGARCHDTLECDIVYDGMQHTLGGPSVPASTYGPNYLDHWLGSYTGVRNFPAPAKVSWRSKDGTAHTAEIDFASIFKGNLVHHFVPREELADAPAGRLSIPPSVLLEVNDQTIRVYIRAFIPTRHLQEPGNPRSGFRSDLVLVATYDFHQHE